MTLSPPPPANPAAGNQTAAQQGRTTPAGWKATPAEPLPVIQCTATKQNGERCQRWSLRGSNVCLAHGGNLPNVRKAAEERLRVAKMYFVDDVGEAYDTLRELMGPGVSEGVRLKAATELLDRAGLKPGMEINVTVEDNRSPLEDLMHQLSTMSERLEDEGEIIVEPDDNATSEFSQTLQEIEEAKD